MNDCPCACHWHEDDGTAWHLQPCCDQPIGNKLMSEKAVTILQQEYTDEDMAAVGRAFMEAIEQARLADPWVKGWAPAQCPSEIIFDLINHRDDTLAHISERCDAEWQPVTAETPRGTTLLLYGRQINNDRSLITYKDPIVFTGYWDDIDSAWCSTGSIWQGPFFHVTHWKPLDDGPSNAPVSSSPNPVSTPASKGE